MDPERIVAVIMAGGGGTRFWPRSRRSRPKQFLSFDGQSSLLRQTVDRLEGFVPPDRTFVITGREHVDLARRHSGLPAESIIGEPVGRDTAACIGLGALLGKKVADDAVLVVLSADQLVSPIDQFQQSLLRAAELADETGKLVSLGIRPDRPATGYGYIELGARHDDLEPAASEVVRFREKPDLETARRFLLAGRYLWNSGMFAFTADAILGALERHLPELHDKLSKIEDPRSAAELERVYPGLPAISIDYGVMEHEKGKLVIESPFSWDDLGTFESVARHSERHDDSNLARGDVAFIDSEGSLVDNDSEGLVVLSGVKDLLVVRTNDAVLVMPRADAERLKDVVKQLDQLGHGDRL